MGEFEKPKHHTMKILGIILTVLGAAGCVYFGIQAAGDSESVSLLGMDIAVSTADWTPLIVSAVVAIAGLLTVTASRKRAKA